MGQYFNKIDKNVGITLEMISVVVLNDRVFADDWQKYDIVSVHKRDLKTLLINYYPIRLLLIVGALTFQTLSKGTKFCTISS